MAEYTDHTGNFTLTANQVLKMCKPSQKYMKYAANNFIFYVLYVDVVYMVMCNS